MTPPPAHSFDQVPLDFQYFVEQMQKEYGILLEPRLRKLEDEMLRMQTQKQQRLSGFSIAIMAVGSLCGLIALIKSFY